MKNLLTAIASRHSGSALSTDVGGRIYLDKVPDDEMPATFPYIIYFIVAGNPEDVFAKKGKRILMQWSLFSASSGLTEITTMYADLAALFDDYDLTITSNTCVSMHEANLATMIEDMIVNDATQQVRHWAVDYEIITQAA